MMVDSRKSKFRTSSGNVFADLGVPEPQRELVKADLVKAICSIVSGQGLRQAEVAARLGISQPKVSLLMRGRTDGFSTDLLMRLLNRLGQSISIVVKPSRPRRPIGVTHVDYGDAVFTPEPNPVYRASRGSGHGRSAAKAGPARATKKK
jgi:predicted XRE-type DNA-binding protein